jgi:hypothetical protein
VSAGRGSRRGPQDGKRLSVGDDIRDHGGMSDPHQIADLELSELVARMNEAAAVTNRFFASGEARFEVEDVHASGEFAVLVARGFDTSPPPPR